MWLSGQSTCLPHTKPWGLITHPTSTRYCGLIHKDGIWGVEVEGSKVQGPHLYSKLRASLVYIERLSQKYTKTTSESGQHPSVVALGLWKEHKPLSLQAEFKVQKEAVCTVANFATGASQSQLTLLAYSGVLEPMLNLLTAPDMEVVTIILDVISYLLQVSCSKQAVSN